MLDSHYALSVIVNNLLSLKDSPLEVCYNLLLIKKIKNKKRQPQSLSVFIV